MLRRSVPGLPITLLLTCVLSAPLCGQGTGTKEHEIEVDGKTREYRLHVSKKYSPKSRTKVPLVLMLHGRGSDNRASSSSYYGWVTMADQKGFIAAFPNALGSPRSWNPAWGRKSTADGEFLAALIDKLLKEYRIDPKKVFVTGHSSGGIMSFSFAATHSGKVAAIAPVAGSIGFARGEFKVTIPKPKAPVRVISFHGMADKVVAYDANTKSAFPGLVSAPDSVAFWAKHNGCSKKPVRKDTKDGKVHIDTWAGCKAGSEVVFYSIEGGSHGWPTGRGSRRGAKADSLEATELIWKFFTQAGRTKGKKQARRTEPGEASANRETARRLARFPR